MTRKERIYNTLISLSKTITINDVKSSIRIGFSAEKIASELKLKRNTVSHELNTLVMENRVIKMKGKPVLFFHKETLENLLGVAIPESKNQLDDIREIYSFNLEIRADKIVTGENDDFSEIIGFNGSLKTQIEQAKAAILYPPNGLPVMIIGETGTGKTLFAENMWRYAVQKKVVKENSPFIVFNCSEYAENPQLLISELFGCIKGAYTGADRDKEGLVERANNGFLFLDEIHRLPPEGQEMLFLLMDKGIFRRLGETEAERKVNIRLIGATTENPSSTFLKTFLRRVPIIINLPALKNRPIEERYEMIRKFFYDESCRIGRSIYITPEAARYFLKYDCEGNIGQLKGDIQFTCAKAFLKALETSSNNLKIHSMVLPEIIRKSFYDNNLENSLEEKIIENLNEDIVISPIKMQEGIASSIVPIIKKTFYDDIEEEYNSLIENGNDEKSVIKIINEKIEKHFEQLLSGTFTKSDDHVDLVKIIPESILQIVEDFLLEAQKVLGTYFGRNVLVGLSLHAKAYIERARFGKKIINPNLIEIKNNYLKEYSLAQKFMDTIHRRFYVPYSEDEVGYITMFLTAAYGQTYRYRKYNVFVLIICHGDKTASSIAKLVNQLIGENIVDAIDMPMQNKVEEIFNKVITYIRKNNCQKLLLLVDMGSLINFGEKIYEMFDGDMEVGLVSAINTPIVLEIARKILYPNITLEHLIEDVKSHDYIQTYYYPSNKNITNDVVLTSCITGVGTAMKIKNIIEETLKDIKPALSIIPIDCSSISEDYLKSMIPENAKIKAIIGTFDPHLPGVPFIPLDSLIEGDGYKLLTKILFSDSKIDLEKNFIKALSLESVIDHLTFLNPKKTIDFCHKVISSIEVKTKKHFSKATIIKLIVHLACMVERLVLKKGLLEYEKLEKLKTQNQSLFFSIKDSFRILEEEFQIIFPDSEIGYVMDIILND
ncbi:sigma-54-dependent transcriptional regulator [Thermoanaerobacteraceae bacterium SP2]|nr:sigma-54-dependent transcriptional regulator [Thermoanaerobacteraceae bacterium SP2]